MLRPVVSFARAFLGELFSPPAVPPPKPKEYPLCPDVSTRELFAREDLEREERFSRGMRSAVPTR